MRNPYGVCQSNLPSPDTFCNPGNDVYVMRQLAVDADGREYLEVTGRISISERINAYKDQTDMAFIIARLSAGDVSVLDRVPAQYGDVSDLPYDHRAMLDIVNNARNYFDHLPAETRAKFDDNFETWFGSSSDPEWLSKMVKQDLPSQNVQTLAADSVSSEQ